MTFSGFSVSRILCALIINHFWSKLGQLVKYCGIAHSTAPQVEVEGGGLNSAVSLSCADLYITRVQGSPAGCGWVEILGGGVSQVERGGLQSRLCRVSAVPF